MTPSPLIYLDNHATTRVDPRVVEAMLPIFTEDYGNPSSRHHPLGWRAEERVEIAREQTARLINAASPDEIIFTSGATESNNLALRGAAAALAARGRHIITQQTEHKAVLDTLRALEEQGFQVTRLPVDGRGRVDPDDVRRAIRPDTILISIMWANNEIGTIQPIEQIGALAAEAGVLFHTDAAQAAGRIPIDVQAAGVHLLSLSAHKFYGPKGIGALYIRRCRPPVRLVPQITGGGQERGLRSGTLAVPNIVGLGTAAALAREALPDEAARIAGLRDKLCAGILGQLEEVFENGDPAHRLPGNLNLSFAFVEGESLLMGLTGRICVSSASACTAESAEPSHVLRAIGLDEPLTRSTLRFGVGRFNTTEEIDETVDCVVRVVRRLREISPLYEAWIEGHRV
ncbi:MAG: IscS subfamily cysteine desulfurase [Candidatus Sumerlaeia bacterium]